MLGCNLPEPLLEYHNESERIAIDFESFNLLRTSFLLCSVYSIVSPFVSVAEAFNRAPFSFFVSLTVLQRGICQLHCSNAAGRLSGNEIRPKRGVWQGKKKRQTKETSRYSFSSS